MAKARVKLKMNGINKLMTSAAVEDAVTRRALRIRDAAGNGFEVAVFKNWKYTIAYVQTDTDAARERQAEDAVLQRALGAGRG